VTVSTLYASDSEATHSATSTRAERKHGATSSHSLESEANVLVNGGPPALSRICRQHVPGDGPTCSLVSGFSELLTAATGFDGAGFALEVVGGKVAPSLAAFSRAAFSARSRLSACSSAGDTAYNSLQSAP
jgi:hypothetical protein